MSIKQSIKDILNSRTSLALKLRYYKLIGGSNLLATFSLMFNKHYKNELKNNMYGIANYIERDLQNRNIYKIRRNVHRLEKGLSYRDRRTVFGVAYLNEIIVDLEWLLKSDRSESKYDDLKHWTISVMDEYFRVVDLNHEKIKYFFNIYTSLKEEVSKKNDNALYDAYPKTPVKKNTIKFNDFKDLVETRKSVRYFLNKPVDRQILGEAIKLAKLSPSACNRQPFRFIIIDDKELLPKITKIPAGTAGYWDNIPCFILVIGDLSAYKSFLDRHTIYVDASLATMTLIYSLEVLELSTCTINWVDNPKWIKTIKEHVNIQPFEKVITCLGIGHSDNTLPVPNSKKKSIEELIIFNQ